MTTTQARRVDSPASFDHDDAALERATMRRVTFRLLPFVFLLYVCAHINRANLSFAALQMNRALRFSGAVYGFGAGIFYIYHR